MFGDIGGRELIGGVTVRKAVCLCAIVAAAVLVVVRFNDVAAAAGVAWSIVSPLIAGAVLAYLLNLIMLRWERILFPHAESSILNKVRRPIGLILSIATIAAFIAFVVFIVSGEIKEAFGALGGGIRRAADAVQSLLGSGLLGDGQAVSEASALLSGDAGAWKASLGQFVQSTGGVGSLTTSIVGVGKTTVEVAINSLVAVVFSLYLLAGKERVLAGWKRGARAVLSPKVYATLGHVVHVADGCFSRFIFGQCLEGTILGCLCALGMTILGLPYAAAIGLCVGVTSLVPLVGAWMGGILGALMIMSVDPIQSVWFVLFLIILQQIEGHLIYPNVVGTSVGVPSIWILVAVFAGGTLFGIAGILLGVPLVATIRQLVREWLDAHETSKAEGGEPPSDSAALSESVSLSGADASSGPASSSGGDEPAGSASSPASGDDASSAASPAPQTILDKE